MSIDYGESWWNSRGFIVFVLGLVVVGLCVGALVLGVVDLSEDTEPSFEPGGYPGGEALDAQAIETWMVLSMNAEREAVGLRPLLYDDEISDIARAHSADMIVYGYEHTINGLGPTDRAQRAGYDCRAYREDGSYSYGLAEIIIEHKRVTESARMNMALVGDPKYVMWPSKFIEDSRAMAGVLIGRWMESGEHRGSILSDNYRRVGVGVAIQEVRGKFWTDEVVYATVNYSKCE